MWEYVASFSGPVQKIKRALTQVHFLPTVTAGTKQVAGWNHMECDSIKTKHAGYCKTDRDNT